MSVAEVDELLRNGIRDWLAHSPVSDDEWDDVLWRARRPRRHRILVGVALAATIIVVVASAVTLTRSTVLFSSAPHAPGVAVRNFASLPAGAPPGMVPGVQPTKARLVARAVVAGAERSLWVAPTRSGGFCFEWSRLTGGCVKSRTQAVVNRIAMTFDYRRGSLVAMVGSFFESRALRLDVRLADGSQVVVPFTWVTSPIDAGFFTYTVPVQQRSGSSQPVSAVLYDGSGHVLAVASIPESALPSTSH